MLSEDAPPRGTAFFEAFPATGSGFIRGEGKTVAEAEEAALIKRRRELACTNHRWGRKGYMNGLVFCRNCGGTNSHIVKPIVTLGKAQQPASPTTISILLEEDDWSGTIVRKRELSTFWTAPKRSA